MQAMRQNRPELRINGSKTTEQSQSRNQRRDMFLSDLGAGCEVGTVWLVKWEHKVSLSDILKAHLSKINSWKYCWDQLEIVEFIQHYFVKK